MRRLGLDIGEKRIGVAVSDPSGRVATPLAVLDGRSEEAAAKELLRLVEEYDAAELLIGLPVSMSGEEGPQASRVREVAGRLASSTGLPLVFFDERLSTQAARRARRGSRSGSRDRSGTIDMAAATMILQTYLDRCAAGNGDGVGPDE